MLTKPVEVSFRPNATIIAEGDTKSGFFILRSGSVAVYKSGVHLNNIMFPGTIFGEMSDILGKPRSCTVKARTDCVLEHYPSVDMRALIENDPDLAYRIFKTLAARLERTTEKLADATHRTTFWSVERPPNK